MIDCKMERKSKLKFYFNFFGTLVNLQVLRIKEMSPVDTRVTINMKKFVITFWIGHWKKLRLNFGINNNAFQ